MTISKKEQNNKNFNKTKAIVFQVTGIFMMIIGILLVIIPITSNIFNKERDSEFQSIDLINDVVIDEKEKGSIEKGINTIRVSAATLSAEEKSQENQVSMKVKGRWIATNYAPGDIGVGQYTVKCGDTLWEMAEAVYGNGNEWYKILERNKNDIGFLKDGSQALIWPGQVLIIAK